MTRDTIAGAAALKSVIVAILGQLPERWQFPAARFVRRLWPGFRHA